MALNIYNTMSRQKEPFAPREAGKVGMYVCGITSYAPSHIGHARMFVAFDVVYRWLRANYEVNFVRNYTDVDDKIIRAANAEGVDSRALAERYIEMFQEDAARLRILVPEVEPKVTEHIPEIIALVKGLEAKGIAYAVDGDVYYDVTRFPKYGCLSGRKLEDMEAGARVEVDSRKKSPGDFALWKSAKPEEPFWESPWGKGRPGWHIECSAMSEKYLGMSFDIHGGGKDLVFPHHENEIAQTCGAHDEAEFAKYWMHNGFVNLLPETCPGCDAGVANDVDVGAKCGCGYVYTEADLKMSKSRGNFYPIREVISEYEPEALRLLFLGTHYRKPIQFSHSLLADAVKRLDKSYETLRAVVETCGAVDTQAPPTDGFRTSVSDALDDDFNTPRALAEVHERLRRGNEIAGQKKKPKGVLLEELKSVGSDIQWASGLLGLWEEAPADYLARRRGARLALMAVTEAEIEALLELRKTARAEKDWGRADEVRDQLAEKGIVIRDGADGTSWDVA